MGVREVARLDRELEAVLGARPRDSAACADVLARAAFACRTDPAAAKRWVEAELLDELVDCYEALGRYDEAITVMRRALQVGWSGQPDGRCRIAELLMRDGRVKQATEIWEQVKADTPDDVWLYNNAGLEYADIDDHDTAVRWLTQGLQLAMATGDPEDLVDQLAELRAESLAELGRPDDDELQQQAASFVAPATRQRPARTNSRQLTAGPADRDPVLELFAQPQPDWPIDPWAGPGATPLLPADPSASPAPAAQPVVLALAWFPGPEYQKALTRWPELTQEGAAKGGKDHADYNRALQQTLQDYADAGHPRLFIAPIRIQPYLDWCAQQDRDPADARAGYAAALAQRGDPTLIAWPPARNQPCWCGSGRKYKQCCGSVRS